MKDKINIVSDSIFSSFKDHEDVDYEDLPSIYNGSCSSVVCNFVHELSDDDLLDEILGKVAHKGTVMITGTEPYEVARLLHNRQVSLEFANNALNRGRYRLYDILSILEKLPAYGMEVLAKQIENGKYYIKAVRT